MFLFAYWDLTYVLNVKVGAHVTLLLNAFTFFLQNFLVKDFRFVYVHFTSTFKITRFALQLLLDIFFIHIFGTISHLTYVIILPDRLVSAISLLIQICAQYSVFSCIWLDNSIVTFKPYLVVFYHVLVTFDRYTSKISK